MLMKKEGGDRGGAQQRCGHCNMRTISCFAIVCSILRPIVTTMMTKQQAL
jgi:hypothetical protein